tara:strand:- start:126 stop:809 length:684 start_codon:yes stop_codon:yes gene_type:complete
MKSKYNLRMKEANVHEKESKETKAALVAQEEQMLDQELKMNKISSELQKSADNLKAQKLDNKQLASEIASLRKERDNAVAAASLAQNTTSNQTSTGVGSTTDEEVNALHEKIFQFEAKEREESKTNAGPKEIDLMKQLTEMKTHYDKRLLEAAAAAAANPGLPSGAPGLPRGARGAPRGRGGARAPARGRGGARAPARGRGGARAPARGRGGARAPARGESNVCNYI